MPNRRARRKAERDTPPPSKQHASVIWLVLLLIAVVAAAVTLRRYSQVVPKTPPPPPIVRVTPPVATPHTPPPAVTVDPVSGISADGAVALGSDKFVDAYQKKAGKVDESTTRAAYKAYADLRQGATDEKAHALTADALERYEKLRRMLTEINGLRFQITKNAGGGTILQDTFATTSAQREDVLALVLTGLTQTVPKKNAKARSRAKTLFAQAADAAGAMPEMASTDPTAHRSVALAKRVEDDVATIAGVAKDLPDATAGFVAEYVNYVVSSAYTVAASGEAP
jgi:hypothetical protein